MPMAKIRERLGVGQTYFSAMKASMGAKSRRMGFLSEFSQFLKDNPDFKQGDVYPRKRESVAA